MIEEEKLKILDKKYKIFEKIFKVNFKEEELSVSIKSIFSMKNVIYNYSSSEVLKNIKKTYDSEIIKILKKENILILGIVTSDEFAIGSYGVFNSKKTNFINKDSLVPGGSGGAGAILVKNLKNHVSIGSSTGGSISVPAAINKVIGFVPNYGVISRYGLSDYSSFHDKIGFIGNNVKDIEKIYNLTKINRLDFSYLNINYFENSPLNILNIVVRKEDLFLGEKINKILKKIFKKEFLINLTINCFREDLIVYDIFSSLSTYSALARYGCENNSFINKNKNNNLDFYEKEYSKKRDNFQNNTIRKLICSKYYNLNNEDNFLINKIFKYLSFKKKEFYEKYKNSYIIFPTIVGKIPKIEKILKEINNKDDNFGYYLALINLLNLPHISINISEKISITITGFFKEDYLFKISKKILNEN